MQLLSHTSTAATTAHGGLSDRLSRLLPYFRHTLSSVRRSVLQCLLALLEADPSGEQNQTIYSCPREFARTQYLSMFAVHLQ